MTASYNLSQLGSHYNQGGTGAVDRTTASKLQESVSVLDFGADPTGATDSTAAIQAAINSAPWAQHGSPIQNGLVIGGGIVTFPKGTYLVTGTLYFQGATRLLGESQLASYIKFRPTSSKTLFAGNTSRYTRGTTWDYVSFENLLIGGDLFLTGYANVCWDMTNVSRYQIKRCYVEQFVTVVKTAGIGYYNYIENCEFYNNSTHVYHQGGNPLTVVGGVFWNYGPEWTVTKPNYLVYTEGVINFNGTSLEPTTAVNNAATFVCVYAAASNYVGAHMNGVYSESNYPLLSVDQSTPTYGAFTIIPQYPYAFPLLQYRNYGSATVDAYPTDVYMKRQPVRFGMTPKRLTDMFKNMQFEKGAYGWTLGTGTNYTTTFDTTVKFFNDVGTMKTVFTNAATGYQVACVQRIIPAASLTRYDGTLCHFAFFIKITGTLAVFSPEVVQTVGGTTAYRISNPNPQVDFGNGWGLYVTDLKVNASADLIITLNANVASGGSATVQCAGIMAFVDGWETLPIAINDTFSDTAAPTTGTWLQGDIVWNSAPTASSTAAWICTTAGTPGTWTGLTLP